MLHPRRFAFSSSLLLVACAERFDVGSGTAADTAAGTDTTDGTPDGMTVNAGGSISAGTSGSTDDEESSSTAGCERCVNLDPDLHLTFDGHLDDMSGNGHHGVTVFEPRYVTGLDGDALVFDADHPYLTANSFASMFESALRDEGITLTVRWRPSHYPSSDNHMIGLRDPGPFEMAFAITCTEAHVLAWTALGSSMLAENPPAGEWVTQTFVISGGDVRYYEWGELKGGGAVDVSVSNGTELRVGGYAGASMQGRVDDLKIWLKPLSESEVSATL